MAMLELRGVSKSYADTPVLRSVDLSVEPGELMFLLGPSGCGKSTLLRIVAGLIRQDSGSIVLNGRDAERVPTIMESGISARPTLTFVRLSIPGRMSESAGR